jgi:hypothetical protein
MIDLSVETWKDYNATYFLFAPIRGGPEELHDHRNVAQKTKITIGVEERRGPVEFGGFPNPLDFPFEGQQVIIVQNSYRH